MAETQDKKCGSTTDLSTIEEKQSDFALEVPRGKNAKPYESDEDKLIRQRQNSARYYIKHKEKILRQRKGVKEAKDKFVEIGQILESNPLGLTAEQLDKIKTLYKKPEISH